MMRLTGAVAVALLFSFSSSAQDDREPDGDDVTLKGGYVVTYRANDSSQYLYLKKGKKTIAELEEEATNVPRGVLGYPGADFTNYFVIVHIFGGGNPQQIELIRKKDGQNILNPGCAWIDADEKQEFLLYCEKGVPQEKDKMILYNVRTGQKQFFPFPEDIFNEPQILNRIELHQLTEKQLVITYNTDNGPKTKTYSRSGK